MEICRILTSFICMKMPEECLIFSSFLAKTCPLLSKTSATVLSFKDCKEAKRLSLSFLHSLCSTFCIRNQMVSGYREMRQEVRKDEILREKRKQGKKNKKSRISMLLERHLRLKSHSLSFSTWKEWRTKSCLT